MSWASARTAAAADRGAGKFVKLKTDGASIRFVPLTTPQIRWVEWRGGLPEDVPPETEGKDVQKSYVFQIYDLDTRSVRVMDLRLSAFEQVAEQVTKHGMLQHYRLERRGTGKKTAWVCVALGTPDPQVERACRAQRLLDLDFRLYPIPEEAPPPGAPTPTYGQAPPDDTPY